MMNLAVTRRAVVSLTIHWSNRFKNWRQASMSGFYDFMAAHSAKKAFSLLTVWKSAWLPV
jgi:CelD/BcsL family acetyltransferase involved in cellulose biosynthesis